MNYEGGDCRRAGFNLSVLYKTFLDIRVIVDRRSRI